MVKMKFTGSGRMGVLLLGATFLVFIYKIIIRPPNHSTVLNFQQWIPNIKYTDSMSSNSPRNISCDDHQSRDKLYLEFNFAHHGRLGNRMFHYASLRGIGASLKHIPLWKRTDPIFQLFEINYNKSVSPFRLDNRVFRNTTNMGIYTESIVDMKNSSTNISIYGYVQSWKYFHNIEDEIRKEFTLQKDKADRVEAIFKGLNVTSRIKVGIHVRRGDFLHFLGLTVAPKSYFDKAIEIFKKILVNPVFIVCTDDLKWVEMNLLTRDVLIVHESVFIDFGVLMSCDHSIVSSGSFGWWTGFLTKGTTIYFRGYPGPEKMYKFHLDDYYPPHWIGLY
ncbi:hypothetical protein SNE40_010675 [Patella caerulea]|uniref:L-Fucosyltransferase n=1 Tax=Patella caerulea TaxID=87958 RepID=A0AAN8JU28_PATCE